MGLERSAVPPHLYLVPTALVVFAGCFGAPKLASPPYPPPNADAHFVLGAQGVRLYNATALPRGPTRGIIYFVLGPEIGSAALYPRFTEQALAAGFATFVLHPRGAGFSDGVRGDLEDYALFLGDFRSGLDLVRERFADLPMFLFGHSVGAALALELASKSASPFAGIVLVNPAYRLKASAGMSPSFFDYVGFAFNYVFRRAALTVDMNSRPHAVEDPSDRVEAEAMQRDPLVVRYFSMRYMTAQKEVMDRSAANAACVTAPLVIVQGAHDQLVDPQGNDEIFEAVKTRDKVKRIAPAGAHGSSAVETMASDLIRWMEEHLPT